MSTQRIDSLDGLRAVAILMVVVSHLSGAPWFVKLSGTATNVLGDSGVNVFFVLSGFLITSLLVKEFDNTGGIDLRAFYIRRCFRIFPAFYTYLLALAGASALGWIVLQPWDLAKAAAYLVDYCPWFSTSNYIRHIWSLSVEEQFYILWPVALWAWGPDRAKWLAIVSVILSPIWRFVMFKLLPVEALTMDRRFDGISDSLATGCLLALFWMPLLRSERLLQWVRSPWSNLSAILAVICSSFAVHPRFYLTVGRSLENIAIAFYLFRCVLTAPKWLNNKVFQRIGVMSYSLYLWQQAFCSAHEGVDRLYAPISIALTAGMAALSYQWIERPFQSLGRSLASRGRLKTGPALL